jgi:hypothetical protein
VLRSWHNAWHDTVASDVERKVNVLEGLQIIRERLDANGADQATMTLVDTIMQRAALPAAAPASAQSLLQLTRMLARTPVANNNITVYNDLLRLEEQLQSAASDYRERALAEEAKPVPKTKKFYKQVKEREKKGSGS